MSGEDVLLIIGVLTLAVIGALCAVSVLDSIYKFVKSFSKPG